MPAPYRRLGRIVKAHGTSGEVSVATTADLAFVSESGADVWIVPPPASGAVARKIVTVRQGPKHPLVHIAGVETGAEAHEVVGRLLLTGGEEAIASGDTNELLGLAVRDRSRGDIGVITDVIVTGANDVLVVESQRYGQVLIPVIDDVVMDVDTAGKTVDVVLLDGLIDEEAD